MSDQKEVTTEPGIEKPTLASVRAQIFKSRKAKTRRVEFFGTEIELRQPKLKDIIDARATEDRQAAVIETLVKYAFVPDTDEHVFTEEDFTQLCELPFGGDFVRVSQALEELTDVNFQDKNVS